MEKIKIILVGWIIVFILASPSCNNKSSVNSTPLFTLTDSSETGFHYWNEIYDNEVLNGMSYGYYYNGGGVAIGDINNDGLPDIYMVGNTYGGRLYLNKGDLKFEQITSTSNTAVGGFTHGVTMADVNNDGYLDIYLSRSLYRADSLRENVLFINNKDNTFTNRAKEFGIADIGYTTHSNFFDYDNDGDLDLYVLNHSIDFTNAKIILPQEVQEKNKKSLSSEDYNKFSTKLYRNNGNGTFSDVTRLAGLDDIFFGLSATVSDINNDGWLDLYCAADFSGKDHLYINQKNGTFKDKINVYLNHISKHTMGVDIADFNNDGLLDILSLDMMAEDNYRNKQLKGKSTYDFFHMGKEFGYHWQVARNCLQLNNGNGTFSEIGQLTGISNTDWSWSPLFADFDNDGKKDLFITNGYHKDLTDLDFINYVSNEVMMEAGGGANATQLEILEAINSTDVSNYIYKNTGGYGFQKKTREWGVEQKVVSNGAAYADLDLDGDLDLVVNNYASPSFLYRNNSRELNPNSSFLAFTFKPEQHALVQGTKVRIYTDSNVQYQELINNRGYLSTVHQILHFGLGENNRVSKVEVTYPNGTIKEINSPMLNQHIVLDITEGVQGVFEKKKAPLPLLQEIPNAFAHRHTESDFIDFKDEPLLEQAYSNRGPYASAGDVNGDGLDDIYFGASAGYSGKLYLQQAAHRFVQKSNQFFEFDKSYEDGRSVFFDADGDKDLDLYVTSGSNEVRDPNLYNDRLYINDGAGNFTKAELPVCNKNTVAVQSLDIENDGDMDLVVGGNVKPNQFPKAFASYVLINDGKGNFTVTDKLLPENGALGIVNDIQVEDFNQDGKPDIVFAGDWMPLTIVENTGKNFTDKTKEYGLEHSNGMWNTVELIDVNADGQLDIVGGNRGMNDFFQCSESQPATLHVGDFDDNGEEEAIPNYYFRDGKLYPKNSFDEILQQLPSWRGLFPRYADYSSATSKEIFAKSNSSKKTLYCYNFKSTAYIRGDNIFSAQHLPTKAQFSPVFGIASISHNKYPQLLTVGNNYGVDVNTGRYDADYGVLSRWNTQSFSDIKFGGAILSGEKRQLLPIRGKNEELFLLLRNNDKPLLFENRLD